MRRRERKRERASRPADCYAIKVNAPENDCIPADGGAAAAAGRTSVTGAITPCNGIGFPGIGSGDGGATVEKVATKNSGLIVIIIQVFSLGA